MEQDAKIDAATAARELTLALLFLNRFREKIGTQSLWRSWKGFDFGTLDKLAEAGEYPIDDDILDDVAGGFHIPVDSYKR